MTAKQHPNHDHTHGEECGHTAVVHDGHVDYVHDGYLHHPEDDMLRYAAEFALTPSARTRVAVSFALVLSVIPSLHAQDVSSYIYSGGTYTTLNAPSAASTLAFGINNSGQVVGGYNTTGGGNYQYGFIYSGGSFTTLSVPGSTWTVAFGINDAGQVVGD